MGNKKEEKPASEQAASAKEAKQAERGATEKKESCSVLEKVGKAAIKEHGLKEVYMASDGTVFRSENDAKNYAVNLKEKSILTVKQ